MRGMLVWLGLLLPSLSIAGSAYGAVSVLEAEAGVLNGVYVTNALPGYSGTGYVDGLDTAGEFVTVLADVAEAGTYDVEIRYASPYGDKTQIICLNGKEVGRVVFPRANAFTSIPVSSLFLESGTNAVSLVADWGWMRVDWFRFTLQPPHVYSITNGLRDSAATPRTVALYDYLKSQYGRKVIVGQDISHKYVAGDVGRQGSMLDTILSKTRGTPQLLSLDFQNYSPRNPYYGFTPHDDGTTDAAISWYRASQSNGIVAIQWHWFAPTGTVADAGHSTFRSDESSFDIAAALQPGTVGYDAIVRDIDAIAIQLRRLSDAGIPVLWRPLHEAGGGWFWWGEKGPSAARALWDLMFERLTVVNGLHNLIWVWSTPEADWYPGNGKVDIFGYDSYPAAFDYGTQKPHFESMWDICGGDRILALTENGAIPDIDRLFHEDCVWSYFSTWNGMLTNNNSIAHAVSVYSNASSRTLHQNTCGGRVHSH